jgi:hypothetical protein
MIKFAQRTARHERHYHGDRLWLSKEQRFITGLMDRRGLRQPSVDHEIRSSSSRSLESSAIMLERAHRTGRSGNARQRADHARETLWHARLQLERFEKDV